MDNIHTKQWRRKTAGAGLIAGLLTLALGMPIASAEDNTVLDKTAMVTWQECAHISKSCSTTMQKAVAILVFPHVVKADLILGGAGGKGALIENGQVTGHYNIGAASAGLQAGVESASQVYVFRTAAALAKLKNGQDWKAGASAGVTLVTADANASAATGDVLVYIFDSTGLNAGVSLDVFDVWKSGTPRPAQS